MCTSRWDHNMVRDGRFHGDDAVEMVIYSGFADKKGGLTGIDLFKIGIYWG